MVSAAVGPSVAAAAAAQAVRGSARPPTSGGQDRTTGGGSPANKKLLSAEAELQQRLDQRLQQEITALTARYSGNAELAERVARARMDRGFAASDPDFAAEIAPLQQRVDDLREEMRRAQARRGQQTIGGNGGDKLGG